MSKSRLFLVAATLIAVAGSRPVQAVPIVGTSSGSFVNPAGPGVPIWVTGVGTNNFTWGNGGPFSSPPSSLSFAGTAFSTETETVFSFGTLTYFNGTIANNTGADTVDLQATLMLTTPSGVNQAFTFGLQLINTSNTGTPEQNADIVNFPNFFPNTTFFVDGVEHTLEMVGFGSVTGDGFTTITSFNVLENRSASTNLLGRVTVNLSPTPEPTTLVLLAAGLLGAARLRRRCA